LKGKKKASFACITKQQYAYMIKHHLVIKSCIEDLIIHSQMIEQSSSTRNLHTMARSKTTLPKSSTNTLIYKKGISKGNGTLKGVHLNINIIPHLSHSSQQIRIITTDVCIHRTYLMTMKTQANLTIKPHQCLRRREGHVHCGCNPSTPCITH
jgi:hypothetical protein